MPDLGPLGHSRAAHRVHGWCSHCRDHTVAEELLAWHVHEDARDTAEREQRAGQRHTVDTITSSQLAAMYDRIELLTARLEPLSDREHIDALLNGGPGSTVRLISQGMWQERDRALNAEDAIARVRARHVGMSRGALLVCSECSGWDGRRCRGVLTPYPCPTLDDLNEPKEQPNP